MPTVLGLLEAGAPERVMGRDIWAQTSDGGDAPEYVVSAFGSFASIRTHKWNLVLPWMELSRESVIQGADAAVRRQLYDLEADPEELTDVIDAHPEAAADLAQRLEEHIRRFLPLTDGTIGGKSVEAVEMTFHALPGSRD